MREGTSVMGRSPENEIVVDEDGVSRRHAEIRGDADGFWVTDLDSRNGTFVNNKEVGTTPHRLRHLDRIELGGMTINTFWVFREIGGTVQIPRPSRLIGG
ncbi:MAG: FHA domain-containing protein [Chloroflexi bacterium]|nr:FHA domain-containing protein [Chloroflexota bacterium]